MVYIARWKVILILVVCALGLVYAAPNILPADLVEEWRAESPAWAPTKPVKLGLDLRGGAYVLLEVGMDQVMRERLDDLANSIRADLRGERIRYSDLGVRGQGVGFVLSEPELFGSVRETLREVDDGLDVRLGDGARVTVTYTEAALEQIRSDVMAQSIEVVRRRVDESGLLEPAIQRQGDDRILLQLPGVSDTSAILSLLRQTAKLNFHLVDDTVSVDQLLGGTVPEGTMVLPLAEDDAIEGETIPVRRRIEVNGEHLTNAQSTFQENQPVVAFQFDRVGGRRFCNTTEQNTGRQLAIVLDEAVISAPRINEPICQNRGIISGNFSPEAAENLAILLRSGALPAPLEVLEERTVGPSLGSDSIEAGLEAAAIAIGLVIVFMVVTYALFGLFASLALAINMVLIFAVLSFLQATLTLPGLAGLVLTIGMAVDANVLIFERIREEVEKGRTIVSSIDAGYNSALSTIVDANLTTLIAAAMLFSFGTGPVQGFAVTLSIGVLTSLFSALMLTRLLVVTWLRRSKPKALPI